MWLKLHSLYNESILVNSDNILYVTDNGKNAQLWIRRIVVEVKESFNDIQKMLENKQ